MDRIVRINISEENIQEELFPEEYQYLGGRSLIDRIINSEIEPTVHPLDAGNKLIICPGFFGGTTIPNSGRLSIGSKSPLTNGIKEANSGGGFAQKIARLRIKALIIEGKPKKSSYTIIITNKSIILKNVEELAGLGNYKTAEYIRTNYGKRVAFISIGPCGEMLMSSSTIATNDLNGYPSRHCARGGLGAVMGSKGIKAIIVDDSGAINRKPVKEESFKKAVKDAIEYIQNNPRTHFFREKGTPGLVRGANERGSLPTFNYHLGSFDGYEGLTYERMKELNDLRGGSMGHACMPGCIVKCSNVFFNKEKKYQTSGLEYETLGMLGSNLGISDMDTLAIMDRKCDDYGIDTIETGATIGILSDIGMFEFGDNDGAVKLIDEIGNGTILGRILGQGVATSCKVFGISRVPAVKGQALPAHSAQSLKGVGVTYSISPQGADHTAGFVADEPLSPVGQIERSINSQLNMIMMDSAGCCMYSFISLNRDIYVRLINSLYGYDLTEEDVLNIARDTLREEIMFNRRAGLTEATDRVPSFFTEEKLEPKEAVFDVSNIEMIKKIDQIISRQ